MSLLIGLVVGVVIAKVLIHRREVRKDLEFYQTMMKCYDDARRIGAPTNHLDNVMKSVNPNRRK